jgi:glycosyltransferase involved in cell wall biosynthesis
MVETHLILEISPEFWRSSLFDVDKKDLSSRLIKADPLMSEWFPTGVHHYWKNAASFNLLVHNCPRSIHPASWIVSWDAIKHMDRLKPDVFHLNDISLRLAPILNLKMNLPPMIVSVHDVIAHSGEADWRTRLTRRLTFRKVQQFLLHNSYSQDGFCTQYNVPESRVSSIPLGVLEIFREWSNTSVPEEEKTILFFGRISEYKGLHVLIEAANEICKKVSNVRFIIAGRPVPSFRVPDFIDLPNNGCFELHLQYISNTLLATLFQRSALVVCPYLDATQSGVVLTAYAFEKPVVATDVGGMREYIWNGETGYLVPPQDPRILAERIVSILREPSRRLLMKKGIIQRIQEDLSWRRIAERTIRIYEQLI